VVRVRRIIADPDPAHRNIALRAQTFITALSPVQSRIPMWLAMIALLHHRSTKTPGLVAIEGVVLQPRASPSRMLHVARDPTAQRWGNVWRCLWQALLFVTVGNHASQLLHPVTTKSHPCWDGSSSLARSATSSYVRTTRHQARVYTSLQGAQSRRGCVSFGS
jgi:hypothetical protein